MYFQVPNGKSQQQTLTVVKSMTGHGLTVENVDTMVIITKVKEGSSAAKVSGPLLWCQSPFELEPFLPRTTDMNVP